MLRFWQKLFLSLIAAIACASAYAGLENPAAMEHVKQDTETKVRNLIDPLLSKYCQEACQLISVRAAVTEVIKEGADIGFDGIDEKKAEPVFQPERIFLEVQIDKQISQQNRQKLYDILVENTRAIAPTELTFHAIEMPNIGKVSSDSIRKELEYTVRSSLLEAIREYCPDACILSYVLVDGKNIGPDEANALPRLEIFKSQSSESYFHPSTIEAALAIDDGISEDGRERILNVLKARTDFVKPVTFKIDIRNFPETHAQKVERLKNESQDPYGLDKLRQMLTLFRDLAGTKEIISTTNSASKENSSLSENSTTNSSSSLTSSDRLREEKSQSERIKEEKEQREKQEASTHNSGDDSTKWFIYVLAIVIVLGLLLFVILKFASANKDAQFMVRAMNGPGGGGALSPDGGDYEGGGDGDGRSRKKDGTLGSRLAQLKDELGQSFLNSPKVARETFARLIHDEGVEEAAKYLHILGKMTIYELVDDPTMQRSLFDLSEYFHKTEFQFTEQEQEQLLLRLKTKVIASEIRVLTQKTIDHFDFLVKMDPAQVFALIQDESPRVQSIVLTQLNPIQRRGVYGAFDGSARTRLLGELCRADAIPKEYLSNVAQALNKKASSKPEFDTQNVRASDVLLDFMERSTLNEQQSLMVSMRESNPDTARTIKMRLVTIEILPYLKTGHLLELILGLEREDLLTFLAGTREHIRDLLLSHAPEELAESWIEDLESIVGIDEKRYQSVENMILNRVRNMASEGIVSLLDINQMIFPEEAGSKDDTRQFSIETKNFVV